MINETEREKNRSVLTGMKITLRAARMSRNLEVQSVASMVGITEDELAVYECDSGEVPLNTMRTILEIYCYPLSFIHIGDEDDYSSN